MTCRDEWREFICSPHHAGRHLSSLGRGVGAAVGTAVDVYSLHLFLNRLDQCTDDAQLLANAVDLIRDEYVTFLKRDLPRVLDHLSNEVLSRDEILGPGLRGNPRWDKTIVGRMSGAIRPGHYYSRVAHKHFVLPENSLLRWLVADVMSAINQIERAVGFTALHSNLAEALLACESALKHHWFGDIPVPKFLEIGMIRAGRHQRRPEYRLASKLAEHRARLSQDRNRWEEILSFLAVNWLEPISDDDLFELYVLVCVLDIISTELGFGEPIEYGLVRNERDAVATFRSSGNTVKVFFDQSPSRALGIADKYTEFLSIHSGISGNRRRPDIIVQFQSQDEVRTVIIDAKKTADGKYKSDSVYKAFGYIYDFQEIWPALYARIKAILVFPDGVTYDRGRAFELLAVSGSDRLGLVDALSASLLG